MVHGERRRNFCRFGRAQRSRQRDVLRAQVESAEQQGQVASDSNIADVVYDLGLEQAGDTYLPQVSIHKRFRPFAEDTLAEIATNYDKMIIAHPGVPLSLNELLPPPLYGRLLLIIGPEGGWVDFEIERFTEQGVTPFHLGPRILRVDSVIPSLLGQIDLLRRL